MLNRLGQNACGGIAGHAPLKGTIMRLSAPIFRLKKRAKDLSRDAGIPHMEALDRLARKEGFRAWAHLSDQISATDPSEKLLGQIQAGDSVIIAARPGHGKTLLALGLAVRACQSGHRARFYSFEYTLGDIHARLADLNAPLEQPGLQYDFSDDISAAHIINTASDLVRGDLIVIDYLQLLDQRRDLPPLNDQISELSAFAGQTGVICCFLAQIHRGFSGAAVPGLTDLRLPNPLDVSHFTRACFLHDGHVSIDALTH